MWCMWGKKYSWHEKFAIRVTLYSESPQKKIRIRGNSGTQYIELDIVHDIPLSPTNVVIFIYLIDERWCRSEIFQFHRQNVVSHSQDHRLPDQSPWVKIVTVLWLITSRSPIRLDAKPKNTSVVAIRTYDKRGNSIPISGKCRKPESTAENPFLHHPNWAPK